MLMDNSKQSPRKGEQDATETQHSLPATAVVTATNLLADPSVCFVTEGGVETHMIFVIGRKLRDFCIFEAVLDSDGDTQLREMYTCYVDALTSVLGPHILMASPTYKANSDHMTKLGYIGDIEVERVNRLSAEWMCRFRAEKEIVAKLGDRRFIVAGEVGPRGDGYDLQTKMTSAEAALYHRPNTRGLMLGGVEVIQAMTMTYADEAAGVAIAAAEVGLPCIIHFTVETDGRIADGSSLTEAVASTDEALKLAGKAAPLFFGVNCAHPVQIELAFASAGTMLARLSSIRVNASKKTHAELDGSSELEDSNIEELGAEVEALKAKYNLRVFGGCCGCDHRHLRRICLATKS